MSSEGKDLDVGAIKGATSIRAVVAGSGVHLVPSGAGRWLGLCPFHPDRRPSLLVDERGGHFHCFGCGAHGDVIDFLRRRQGLSFVEACRWLEDDGQYRPAPVRGEPPRRPTRAALGLAEQVVLDAACAVYQHSLAEHPEAKEYLRERAIPDWLVSAAGLGYADGEALRAFLHAQGWSNAGESLGLLRREGKETSAEGYVETMSGRLIVPELRGGRCHWLIGRILPDPGSEARFRALPGPKPVLGLERAAGRRAAFLCEGVFDWLTALSWGLPAFSPCGTHLPAERLGFLASASTVYGVLDADDAGRAAGERFGAVLGRKWVPLALPDGLDLNDLAMRPGGREEFFATLARARRTREEEAGGE